MFSLDGFSNYSTDYINLDESKSNQPTITQNSEDEPFLTEIVTDQNNKSDKELKEKILTEHDIDQFLEFITSQRKLWPTLDGIRNHIKSRSAAIISGKLCLLSGFSGLGLLFLSANRLISMSLLNNLGYGTLGTTQFFALTSFALFVLAEKFFSSKAKKKMVM